MFAGVKRLLYLLIMGSSSLGWGFSLIKDSPDRLAFEESVGSPLIQKCGARVLVSAPTSKVLGSYAQPAVPYMTYTVAIPAGINQPKVIIQDISDTLILGELSSVLSCADPKKKMEPLSNFAPLFLGPAVDRDGVRRIMVGIPLVRKSGSGLLFRKQFRVEVTWPNGSVSMQGGTPGKRALSQVINPAAAKAFFQGSPSRVLKRSVADVASGIEWFLQIPIGDREIATFEEDGIYALPYLQLRNRLRGTSLNDRIDGIRIGSLTVASGNPDTLHDSPQTTIPETGPLKEHPIHVLDHSGPGNLAPDGIWNEGDTLLFFATGTSLWKASGDPAMPFYFASNVYSFTRYFYVGVRSDQSAPRLEMVSNTNGGNSVTSLPRYLRAEKDLTLRDTYFGHIYNEYDENSGREWFWIWGITFKDSLVVPSSEITLPHLKNLPGLLPNTTANLAVGFFPYRGVFNDIQDKQVRPPEDFSNYPEDARFEKLRFRFFVNGEEAPQSNIRLPGGQFILSAETVKASNNQFELHILPNQSQFDRFDGFSVAYQSEFMWNGHKETWPIAPTTGKQRYTIAAAPQDLRALRIANGVPRTVYSLQNGAFSDSLSQNEEVSYHLFRWGSWNAIADSMLIAMEEPLSGSIEDASQLSGNYDYVVICPKEWVPAALRIKSLREGSNVSRKTRTAIVDLDQIWMHFGSGFSSPHGIRDFLRYARHQWPDLRQALLVGDGHPDYRKIRQSSGGMPIIPPFEVNDLGSDDFFAILDSGEVFPFGDYDIDLAIGRLPVNTLSEFETYLRKMEEYESIQKQDLGLWRNTLLMAADDYMQRDLEDNVADHTQQTEKITGLLKNESESTGFPINIQRLYLLNYEADMSYEKPNAASDLIAKINQGALFTVYFGHGSTTDWADEGLLRPYMLQSVDNTGRYTIMGSFACTVGRFDLATSSSLSETFLRAEGKGAIGSIGAMRESFPSHNESFATDMLKSAYLDSAGTLGQAYWHGKGTGFSTHSFSRYNTARYVLLGEPALLLPNTKGNVIFDTTIDTIQALDQMKLSGQVEGMATTGKLFVEVMEGVNRKKLIQERISDVKTIDVDYQGRVIHSELLDYKDGKFQLEFLTPRKLNFGDTTAQVRVWAWSPTDARVGRGLIKNIVLNGTSPNAALIVDTIPPQVHFRPCGFPDSLARDYTAGTTVRMEIPACLEIMIDDSLGLDLQEQPDEGISFEILGYKDPWHPSPFLEQSGKRVMTRLRFNSSYKAGYYTLRVAAQDKLGNRTQRDIRIELQGTLKQAITGVFNAPNPVGKSGTTFYFRNLAENHTSAVAIEIFSVDGRLVKVIQNAKSGLTRWDGRDQWGRLLANGLYHYVVTGTVYSDGKARRFKAKQKLVISR